MSQTNPHHRLLAFIFKSGAPQTQDVVAVHDSYSKSLASCWPPGLHNAINRHAAPRGPWRHCQRPRRTCACRRRRRASVAAGHDFRGRRCPASTRTPSTALHPASDRRRCYICLASAGARDCFRRGSNISKHTHGLALIVSQVHPGPSPSFSPGPGGGFKVVRGQGPGRPGAGGIGAPGAQAALPAECGQRDARALRPARPRKA